MPARGDAFLEKADKEDTLLSYDLLVVAGDGEPELLEIRKSILHIQAMAAIYRMRQYGCGIERRGKVFLVTPPPRRGYRG